MSEVECVKSGPSRVAQSDVQLWAFVNTVMKSEEVKNFNIFMNPKISKVQDISD
jgi:hypothetical protein